MAFTWEQLEQMVQQEQRDPRPGQLGAGRFSGDPSVAQLQADGGYVGTQGQPQPQGQGQAQAPGSGGMNEEQMQQLYALQNGLMQMATAFEPSDEAKQVRPLPSPYNGANFNMNGSAHSAGLQNIMNYIISQGGRL
jgi:hypothetical protein